MFRSVSFPALPFRQVQSILKSETAWGAATSIGVSGSSAIASFAMLTALARVMPESEFGQLASWMNSLFFLSVVAVFGQEMLFIRSWGEFVQAGRFSRARGVLLFGMVMSLIGAVAVACCVAVASRWLTLRPEMAFSLVLFLLVQTLCLFSSQTSRITVGIIAGVFPREIAWRCIVLLAVAWFSYMNLTFSVAAFFFIAAGGILSAIVLHGFVTIRALPEAVRAADAEVDVTGWSKRSFQYWIASLLEAASQYLDVIIIAAFLPASDVAAYFVCLRLAALFSMLNDALGIYSSKQISLLYYRSEHDTLQRTLQHLSLLMGTLCVPSMLVVVLAGGLLLQIFGSAYPPHHAILIILCLGTATVASGGPTTQLLLLTGHQTAYIRALAIVTAGRYVCIACFGSLFGLVGAAIANAAAMIALTIALTCLCRILVGIDPSLLNLANRKPERGSARMRTRQG